MGKEKLTPEIVSKIIAAQVEQEMSTARNSKATETQKGVRIEASISGRGTGVWLVVENGTDSRCTIISPNSLVAKTSEEARV